MAKIDPKKGSLVRYGYNLSGAETRSITLVGLGRARDRFPGLGGRGGGSSTPMR